jgi:hypothetical protein
MTMPVEDVLGRPTAPGHLAHPNLIHRCARKELLGDWLRICFLVAFGRRSPCRLVSIDELVA